MAMFKTHDYKTFIFNVFLANHFFFFFFVLLNRGRVYKMRL